jgi:UDP-N-acetylglucosamine transferase subunit ALG13
MNWQSTAKLPGKPRILIAPLDWGLGHATRCIPLIHELIAQGAEPWLAAEGLQEKLLKEEFPQLPFLQLRGYRIVYSKTRMGMIWKIFRQASRLKKAIETENQWLKKMVDEYHFDAVISDNRFGLYHKNIPCIYITHQLTIKSLLGKWSEKLLQKRNYSYINRFHECWVPDIDGQDNLAGDLSHPALKPAIPLHYIGWLSRFRKTEVSEKSGHLLIILSGPEPQRSLLEEKIIKDIGHYNGTATIVRGLPGSPSLIPSTNMIRFYNHLGAAELNKEMMEAEYVISRGGYSTLMDVLALQKKSILIATPGQTEQEYLAGELMKKRMALAIDQKSFMLNDALTAARQFTYHLPVPEENNRMPVIIRKFLSSLNTEW